MKRTLVLVVAGATLAVTTRELQTAELTIEDLVHRLTDMTALAVLPERGESSAMWSSYDRRARYDEATGKYVDWFSNGDGDGRIRDEGDAQVIAEMTGPGVIWRIWSAMPKEGHVKIWIDRRLAVDMPFAHYFDAEHPPFDYPALGYESARGKNLYFPIPYQKSCRVVAEKGWGRYYHISYTTYPKGTKLPSFSTELSPATRKALREANDYLANRLGTDPHGTRDDEATIVKKITVGPGASATVAELEGPRAITALRARAEFAGRADELAALRHMVLRITWDDERDPAVWCPLGDFFGTAPGVNRYRSLPVGMTDDGYYSLWYMPFRERARIEIVNDGEKRRELAFRITHAPLDRPISELGRFHAKWHRDAVSLPKDRWPDWLVLRTRGRGRFCGMMLHVWNPRGGQCPEVQWCHGHYWWGEGDEKFFVDGEKFPSTFGTGTEDYFGYAWGNGSLFERPFHNQTICESNAGHICVNRFQVVDNVPFQESFEAAIEKYFPNDWPTLYAAVAYWYVAPGGTDPHGPVPPEDRHGYYRRPPVVAGGFTVLKHTAGTVRTQDLAGVKKGLWSNDDHLWWTDARPGARLDLALDVEADGSYDVDVFLTKAVDYGIVRFHLDGKPAGAPVDLYNDGVTRTPAVSLGTHRLERGAHTLTVEIVGANERAVKKHMFGLDDVRLVPKR